jgi:hypothetical protein
MGVMSGPFRPIVFLFTESMAPWGIPNFPSGPFTGVTSTDSHWIGTYPEGTNKEKLQTSDIHVTQHITHVKYINYGFAVALDISTICINTEYKDACNVSLKIEDGITWAAAKIFWTAAEISGPIPSPGMSVTVLVDANRAPPMFRPPSCKRRKI